VEIPVASRVVAPEKVKGKRQCRLANGVASPLASGNATGEQEFGRRHQIAMELAMELNVAGRAGGW
jgi:hypothetical protein